MPWICWLARCLNWGQCCEAAREFGLGFFIAPYLPNSGRDWLHLMAVWPPSHFGAAKSNTSTCFMHKHINRITHSHLHCAHIHTQTRAQSFEWWKCRLRREDVDGMRWDEMSRHCHCPWACLMARHTPILKSTHTRTHTYIHTVLAQKSNKMAALIELISIFGQKDIYTPL